MHEPTTDLQRDLNHFSKIWEYRRPHSSSHSAKTWDDRAAEWDAELRADDSAQLARIRATVDYLRGRGLLGADMDVIDIGCGPGRFAAEFARTARSVIGLDFSPKMIEYGKLYAQEQGLDNLTLLDGDFRQMELRELGWEERFDLVFTSITPAINGKDGLRRVMSLSRAWCYNSCFVRSRDTLYERLMQDVFGRPAKAVWGGHWFYALTNLLYLQGYYPETYYYKQEEAQRLHAGMHLAQRIVELQLPYGEQTEAAAERIFGWLMAHADADGMVLNESMRHYGWVLWDVRERTERTIEFGERE